MNAAGRVPGYFNEDFEGRGAEHGWYAYGGLGRVDADPDNPANRVYRLKYNGDISISYYCRDGTYWKDYSYEAGIRLDAPGSLGGLAFKILDENNFYILSLNMATAQAEIQGRTGGGQIRILAASSPLSIAPARWHRLKVVVVGRLVRGYVDGVQAVEWENGELDWSSWGKIGLRTPHELWADDIRVTPIYGTGQVPAGLVYPASYTVFQRNEEGWGMIGIDGYAKTEEADRVEARVVVMNGGDAGWKGMSVDWTPIAFAAPDDSEYLFFRDRLTVREGGWYRLEVRGWKGSDEIFRTAVDKVGVGDIFLVGGQSNSGNSGGTRMIPADDRVAAISRMGGDGAFGRDPLHGVNGTMGSSWSLLGEKLVEVLNVPVGFIGFGRGGTVVAQWVPEATDSLYHRLKEALDTAGRLGGAKAVLWHQGETDSDKGTTAGQYRERLAGIIERSRLDAPWNPRLLWGIAVVSYSPYSVSCPERMETVAEGHRNTVLHVPDTFLGADTDDLREGFRRTDEPSHLNEAGQREHAERWFVKLRAYFYEK
ncbi:MAG: hypothetical protein K0R57_1882 [Paenibacillaceae bacterium]|jgi:hypothetical protein|nr:hypothetical protein [Paenibacillaceae bacterium]